MPPNRPEPEPPSWPKLVLRRSDQAVAAVVLSISLALLAGHWGYQHWGHGRLIEIDRAQPISIAFQIDINEADWPEFCLLPGVGEVLAKRIVQHRLEQGPFEDLNALRQVRGIGPKTFDGMQPYLMPLPGVESTADRSLPSLDRPGS
jgi:competence ComEA-like helix-hairpin-helix protein